MTSRAVETEAWKKFKENEDCTKLQIYYAKKAKKNSQKKSPRIGPFFSHPSNSYQLIQINYNVKVGQIPILCERLMLRLEIAV